MSIVKSWCPLLVIAFAEEVTVRSRGRDGASPGLTDDGPRLSGLAPA
jgi:hypothetical protein